MLLMFSRGFKHIIKTAKIKEFPGLENKFQNPRGLKEIKDTWEPCRICEWKEREKMEGNRGSERCGK